MRGPGILGCSVRHKDGVCSEYGERLDEFTYCGSFLSAHGDGEESQCAILLDSMI